MLSVPNQWVAGSAGTNQFPTDGQGGGTVTPPSSLLHLSTDIDIFGIYVTVAGAAATIARASNAAGTAIPGLTVDASTTGWKPFGLLGVRYSHATNANVCITSDAGVTATLYYRRIK